MKKIILGLLTLWSSLGWASLTNDASLFIEIDGEIAHVLESRLKAVNDDRDPLLCRRVMNKLEYLQRLDRQIMELQQKLIDKPGAVSQAEWRELQYLEKRRQEDYDFLSTPAPTLMVNWQLPELPEVLTKRLLNEEVKYQLSSYALLWEGNGESFKMPPNTAGMVVTESGGRLTLVLKSSVANYCSRSATELRLQF